MSVGIFDSGLGGLTVLKEIRKIFPNEEIFYFGDTARVPYGEKTKDLIVRYSKEITDFLLTKNISALVVACNTATALAIEELKADYDIPVIGVIEAGVRGALSVTKTNEIGVIGTKATINSEKYKQEIQSKNKDIIVYQKACPLFVPVVEEGLLEGEIIESIIRHYLGDFDDKVDTLILGCTHYPLLKKEIHKLYPNLNLIDPAMETALDLKRILTDSDEAENKTGHTKYYVSDGVQNFRNIGSMFLEEEIEDIELIKL
ncbi:glutamate racemase [Sebaldella sp. S0638]|uniref:glutamate racemase n=1 Tax=Sebaldella sp. S0638 TaxID=2957809 RepID=UPI0020A11855|nr:glutamate racemase [Sebaldella sp. S0638]MCP1224155.1 glutamate racemase [Sebaldella sp. S0638]